MILQQLYRDAEAIYRHVYGEELPPPMYALDAVKWLIPLSLDGKLAGEPIPMPEKASEQRRLVPHNYGRSSDVVANLLVDTANYALGAQEKQTKTEEVDGKEKRDRHLEFRRLVAECYAETQSPIVGAVLTFLGNGGLTSEQRPAKLEDKDRVTFIVETSEGDVLPTDLPEVKQFWDNYTRTECKGKPKAKGICSVTSLEGYIESVLPCDIVISRESAPLVSMNENASWSYGFEQSENASISRDAAEAFTKALTALMRGNDTYVRFALTPPKSKDQKELYFVFWTPKGVAEDIAIGLEQPTGEIMKRLLQSPYTTEEVLADDSDQFFALAISGNKARVVFRSWLKSTLPNVKARLLDWYQAHGITIVVEDTSAIDIKHYGVTALAKAPFRRSKEGLLAEKIITTYPVAEKIITTYPVALVRAALFGNPIPREMMARTIMRCRLEQSVTPSRASLMKATLILSQKKGYQPMPGLDEQTTDPAYVCGRLLALLEEIQARAQGDLNRNIIDRFFSIAVSSPRRALPIMIKLAKKAHLPKIRRAYRKGADEFEGQMGHLMGLLHPDPNSSEAFPLTLQTERQAIFLLGYYHQRVIYMQAKKVRIEQAQARRLAQQNTQSSSVK